MRVWVPLLAATLGLAGCGSPGEPLPPALNRPARVADLSVVERGGSLVVTFTLPERTTEDLPIKTPPEIEMRAGIIGDRFEQADWERESDRIPADAINVDGLRVEARIAAAKYVNRTVVAGVRLLGPKGRNIGWAVDVVNVLPELPKPEMVTATDVEGGVGLEWRVPRPAAEFRIFRRASGEKDWTQAGTSGKNSFTDAGVEYGKTYEYFVQAGEKTGAKYAESESSAIVSIKPADRFGPAAPVGLTAVPGTRSMELVWENSGAADLAFYRVYRDGMKVGDALPAPSFSDRDVVAGAKHAYQVTAVDTAGNESPRSATVEAALP